MDRTAVTNPYSAGLAAGIREAGADCRLGVPPGVDRPPAFRAYPLYGEKGRRLRKGIQLPRAVGTFAAALRTAPPHVVHFQWPSRLDLWYAQQARRRGSRIVYTAHVPVERMAGEWQGDSSNLRMMQRADAVIVHGPWLREQLSLAQPDVADRVHFVEHGNYEHVVTRICREDARRELNLSPASTVISFLGQVRARKGIEDLLRATASATEHHRSIKLVIAGTATDRAYLEKVLNLARELRLDPLCLIRPSGVPQSTLDLAAGAANLVAVPARAASQSGSVILGMSYGRCVATTSHGEVPRIVNGHGLLVPPADIAALSTALRFAVEHPARCDEIGAEALNFARTELSWSRIGTETTSLYSKVL